MTSRYHSSKISEIQSNDDGDGNENGKKAIGFLILAKQRNRTYITFFRTFLTRRFETAT